MTAPHDTEFAGAAVEQGLLTPEQVTLAAKVQKVLGDLGISKPLALIAVEAEWMELERGLQVVTGLRKRGVAHPELKPRPVKEGEEDVVDRLLPPVRKRLENASRTLATLFYARGAGSLAVDLGAGSGTAHKGAGAKKPRASTKAGPGDAPQGAPPRKSGVVGAIITSFAAVIAIIALIFTRMGGTPAPELEPPPIAKKRPAPPPKPPPPPPPPPPAPVDDVTPDAPPDDPSQDQEVENRRKKYIEEQEREAEKLFEEIKKLIAEERFASARGKLKLISANYGWTDFVKRRVDEIARFKRDADSEAGAAGTPPPQPPPDGAPNPNPNPDPAPAPAPVPAVPALPALSAAAKRIDDAAAADARRAAGAKARLGTSKTDLVLRGGKVVKAAEIVDVSREDLRVRGELDGAKVDLLLSWSALDTATFLNVQKQIAKGQGAAGLFDLGRAAIQRRLWKDARAAFDDCAKADPGWKPLVPDLAALLSSPAIPRGSARRLGDGRLLLEYSFADPDQAGDFTPFAGTSGTATIAANACKLAGKETGLWSLKDVLFSGDIDILVTFEGSGEAIVGFAVADDDRTLIHLGAAGARLVPPKSASGASPIPFERPPMPGTPVRIERRGSIIRVIQGDAVRFSAVIPGGDAPRRVLVGAVGETSISNLWVAGTASEEELAKRLAVLERLEGCAHVGDFKLEAVPADTQSASRLALAESTLHAGQLEEAWTLVDDALNRVPAGALAISVRGLIRLAQGETRLAVEDADLAMALDPCRGEIAIRARRILAPLRGAAAFGAHRRRETGAWDLRTDASEERLSFFAAKLDEWAKGFAEALAEGGAAPKGLRVAVFASRDACLAYLEGTDGRDVAVVDGPGAEPELLLLAARAYVRAVIPAAPSWFSHGLASHLAREVRASEVKGLLPQAAPLDALIRRTPSEFTEADRIQSASIVRFFLGGAHKAIVADLVKKTRLGVPAIEAFSGKSLSKLDEEWKAWAAADTGK